MSLRLLDALVSRATGENPRTVRRLGFSVADPLEAAYDPEPTEAELDRYLDWDDAQNQRVLALD